MTLYTCPSCKFVQESTDNGPEVEWYCAICLRNTKHGHTKIGSRPPTAPKCEPGRHYFGFSLHADGEAKPFSDLAPMTCKYCGLVIRPGDPEDPGRAHI